MNLRTLILIVVALLVTTSAAESALFRSIQALDRAAFDAALRGEVDIDARDEFGQTALMYTVGADQIGMTLALLERGASLFAQNDAGWTALHYAARDAVRSEMLNLLLDAGADPFVTNEQQQTALDVAREVGNSLSVTVLQQAVQTRLDADRWLRVLGVPRPVGPVIGVSIVHRSLDRAGTVGSEDDVHIWFFDLLGQPTRDAQTMVLDATTIRTVRTWILDERGQPLRTETILSGERVTDTFTATARSLTSRAEGGINSEAEFRFDGRASVEAALTTRSSGGGLVINRRIEFDSDGRGFREFSTFEGAEISRNRFDAYNRRSESLGFGIASRYAVTERDRFGNAVRALVYTGGSVQPSGQIEYFYAYGSSLESGPGSVRVNTYSLRVRTGPGLATARVGAQYGGASGVLLANEPRWADGYWWWNVRFGDGTSGWVANGDAEEDWLVDDRGVALTTPAQPPAASPAPRATAPAAAPANRALNKVALARAIARDPGTLVSIADEPLNTPYVALWYEMFDGAMRVFIVDTSQDSFCRWEVPRTRWVLNGAYFSNMGRGGSYRNITFKAWTSDYGFRNGAFGLYQFAVTSDDTCWALFSPQ